MPRNPNRPFEIPEDDGPTFGAAQGINGPMPIIGSVRQAPTPSARAGNDIPSSYGNPFASRAEHVLGQGSVAGSVPSESQARAWVQEVGHGGDPVAALEANLPQSPRQTPNAQYAHDKDSHEYNAGWQAGAEPVGAAPQGSNALGLALSQAMQILTGTAQAKGPSVDELMRGQKAAPLPPLNEIQPHR